jgi:hypothetical protein
MGMVTSCRQVDELEWRALCDALKLPYDSTPASIETKLDRYRAEARPSGMPQEFKIWVGIKSRCDPDSQNEAAKNYAGRGLTVCLGWSVFKHFYTNLGPRPSSSHSVDRIDNDGGYWCGKCVQCLALGRRPNCRWATRSEQSNNTRRTKRLTLNGITKTMKEWSKEAKIGFSGFRHRLETGWSLEQALLTPVSRAPHTWIENETSERIEHTCSTCGLVRRRKPAGGNMYLLDGHLSWARTQRACEPRDIDTSHKVAKQVVDAPVIKAHRRFITAFGKTQHLTVWAKETGIPSVTINRRIRRGWLSEDALTVIDGRKKGQIRNAT